MLCRAFEIAVGKSQLFSKNNNYQLLFLSKFSTDGINKDSSKLRTKLSLRRQHLPKFPSIDYVRDLNRERFLPSNFKTVQYGDYEFQACLEDYVQVYTSGYQMPDVPNGCCAYGIYYGEDHPLNESGPVDRRQALHHAKLFAVLRALKSIPQGLFSKVSMNVDDMSLGRFIAFTLPEMSENSFRSVRTGKLNKDLETNTEVNRLLRTRQDLIIRIQYTPHDIGFPPSHNTAKIAKNAANDIERKEYIRPLIEENLE